MGWLFYLNWQLTLITLVMAPPIAVAVRLFSRRLRKVSRGFEQAMGKITQGLQETIEYSCRCWDVADEFAPILQRPIGGHDRRAGFVPTQDDLEEVLARTLGQLLHAHIVDDE